MKKFKAGIWMLAMAMVIQLLSAGSAEAAETAKISWGEEVKVTYDQLHPYTLNWSGDVMKDGGLNMTTRKVTAKGAEADIVINQYGSMGANGILELEDEDLQDPTDSDLAGFANSVTIKKGAVYLLILHDGTYAKLRIDRYLPETGLSINKVFLTYVMEDGYAEEEETAHDDGEWAGGPLEIGDPLDDWDAAEDVYEFEEGEITLPWNALEGHVSWDLYRSDNGEPYVKMTDFRLTKPEFTDKYTFAGHVYLYKFVAYNGQGEAVYMSPAVIVSVVEAGAGAENGGGHVIVLQLDNTTASVNGQSVKLDVAPFLKDGRTLVPLRFVTEALGAILEWNGEEESITLRRGTDKMKLVLNSSEALVNGKTVFLDVPAINHKGRTMVPIRFVIENFDLEIEFDDKTRTITIYSKQAGEGTEEDIYGDEDVYEEEAPQQEGSVNDFVGKWAMWVPGSPVTLLDNHLYLPGADAGTLTIYEDGSYTYPWNGELVSGNWKRTGQSNQILLVNYKFESDWTLTLTEEGDVRATTSPGLREDGKRIE